jgi:eukaryotic-like serine/threonine-protein kinase
MTAMRIAIRGRIVEMPSVVGQSAPQAQQTLAAKGLQFRVIDRIYSNLPADTVLRQRPAPGETIKIPQDAHVVLSLGPQKVMIPYLTGRSTRAARIILLESGLQLGEVSTIYLPEANPDTVLNQNPPPASAAASPHVDLLVAAGDRPVTYVMPAVIGMDQQSAERMLAAADLRVVKINRIAEPDVPIGTVIGQTPPRGSRIDANSTVELAVADSPNANPPDSNTVTPR